VALEVREGLVTRRAQRGRPGVDGEVVRFLCGCNSTGVYGHGPTHSAALSIARIASRIAGGSVDQDWINWASSGLISAFSFPSAAHSAELTKTESRNALPNGWLEEPEGFPSTPASGFRVSVYPPATPCTTGGCFIRGKSVCDPVQGQTATMFWSPDYPPSLTVGDPSENSMPGWLASGSGPSE